VFTDLEDFMDTKTNLQHIQEEEQVNQTLLLSDDEELSDTELAALNGGAAGPVSSLVGSLPLVGPLVAGLLGPLGL
jgi:hypothetical protein